VTAVLGQINPRATKAKVISPLNRRISDWRQLVWERLVKVKCPWLPHVAIMAIAGVRPEKTCHVSASSNPDGALVLRIRGAKVSDAKGQTEHQGIHDSDGRAEQLSQGLRQPAHAHH
jgi:hypothetical protein